MSERLSIIVPSCGRPTLAAALESIRAQPLWPGDEVLLITDGPVPWAARLFRRLGLPGRCRQMPPARDWGATQRNAGLALARGDYLLFQDDDDVYLPGALAAVRTALREAPGRPHVFRMRYAVTGAVLWHEPVLALGNVSTQMLAVPRRPDLVPWDPQHGHDYRFLKANLGLWPDGALVWRPEVVTLIRPHEAAVEPPRPESCPWRKAERGGAAWCELVRRFSGVTSRRLCRVAADACTACLRGPAPSPAQPGPVVASLVYAAAEEVLARGGVPGCSAKRAGQVQAWAEQHLG